jgi:hypothetical protein
MDRQYAKEASQQEQSTTIATKQAPINLSTFDKRVIGKRLGQIIEK